MKYHCQVDTEPTNDVWGGFNYAQHLIIKLDVIALVFLPLNQSTNT